MPCWTFPYSSRQKSLLQKAFRSRVLGAPRITREHWQQVNFIVSSSRSVMQGTNKRMRSKPTCCGTSGALGKQYALNIESASWQLRQTRQRGCAESSAQKRLAVGRSPAPLWQRRRARKKGNGESFFARSFSDGVTFLHHDN